MPPPKRRSRNANCPKWLAYGNPVVRSEGNGTEEAIMDELERDGLRNQAKGKAKKASGKIRDAVADLTDSPEDDLRAKAKRVEGEIQDRLGRAQRKAGEEMSEAESESERRAREEKRAF